MHEHVNTCQPFLSQFANLHFPNLQYLRKYIVTKVTVNIFYSHSYIRMFLALSIPLYLYIFTILIILKIWLQWLQGIGMLI